MRRPVDIHWHIYSRDQIRPEYRGRLIYVLELAACVHAPILQEVFDPDGREFPAPTRERFSALIEAGYHTVVYAGLNKPAVDELMAQNPELLCADLDFRHFNRHLLLAARYSLLLDPVRSEAGAEHVHGGWLNSAFALNR